MYIYFVNNKSKSDIVRVALYILIALSILLSILSSLQLLSLSYFTLLQLCKSYSLISFL